MSTQRISFPLLGMRSAGPKCAGDIERVLTQLDGVITAKVNYASERAIIIYDPDRIPLARMINAVRSIGFDTPLEHLTLYSTDMLYATSARSVEKALGKPLGVVQVSANISAQQVKVDILPDHARGGSVETTIGRLGFRHEQETSQAGKTPFLIRTALLVVVESLAVWSAGAHARLLASPDWLHTPVVVIAISLAALFGIGFPFYRSAYDAALDGQVDVSVLVALSASAFAIISLPIGLFLPSPWFMDVGSVAAITLATGWFVARGLSFGVYPKVREVAESIEHAPKTQAKWGAAAAGILGVLAMVGVYLAIISILQSPAHAIEQLQADGAWVGLVAFGFGAQIGLFAYMHLVVQAAQAAGATAVTGASTGTSAVGMLACCAHHVTDIAPLVALAGTSSLSGAIGFLTEWKYAFIAFGLAMNVIGIIITIRTIQREKSHLDIILAGA